MSVPWRRDSLHNSRAGHPAWRRCSSLTYGRYKSGTANVGRYFKAQDRFGTIAVGQRADLILVDANPLQDVANMEKRSGVMIRGRWLPASEIDARLARIAAAR